jgi:hypothetical protein
MMCFHWTPSATQLDKILKEQHLFIALQNPIYSVLNENLKNSPPIKPDVNKQLLLAAKYLQNLLFVCLSRVSRIPAASTTKEKSGRIEDCTT